MSKSGRIATTVILVSASLLATMCAPVPVRATGFDQFNKMTTMIQAELVAVMVDATQKVLRDSGRGDFADQIEQLFTKVEPGDAMSIGLVELERNIAEARVADARKHENDPKTTQRLAVEDALFVTLEKNNMPMTTPVMNAVLDVMDRFHAQTYAEFEKKSPTEQRQNIALLAKLGWPDWVFRDAVESRIEKKDPLFDDPDLKQQMADLFAAQFPIGSSKQPGFVEVATDIAGEYAKEPEKSGPLYNLIHYLLDQLDAQLTANDKEMDARSVVLPDGRHVFPDKNGVFWFLVNGQGTKLEDSLQPLAESLRRCKDDRGIADGEQALSACRSEVGITDASPRGPALNSPPDDDDPIGEGGFITPPQR